MSISEKKVAQIKGFKAKNRVKWQLHWWLTG